MAWPDNGCEAGVALQTGPSPRLLAACQSRIGYAIRKKRPVSPDDWTSLLSICRQRSWRPVATIGDEPVPVTPMGEPVVADEVSTPQKKPRRAETEESEDEEMPELFPRDLVQQMVDTGREMLRTKMQAKIDRITVAHHRRIEKLQKQVADLQEANDRLTTQLGDSVAEARGNMDIWFFSTKALNTLAEDLPAGRMGSNLTWRMLQDPFSLGEAHILEPVAFRRDWEISDLGAMIRQHGKRRVGIRLLEGRQPRDLGPWPSAMCAQDWWNYLMDEGDGSSGCSDNRSSTDTEGPS